MELLIEPAGSCRCVYDEAIDVCELGKVTIRRGSHVEPTETGQWTADLAPSGGPVLGPFEHRSQAIKAEIDWLRENWLNCSSAPPPS